jgi:hypothetical protein
MKTELPELTIKIRDIRVILSSSVASCTNPKNG